MLLFIFKASSFSKQSSFYFVSVTFIQMPQPFFTELRDEFKAQSNLCDEGFLLK